MTLAHDKACETIDALNSRLDKIDDMAIALSGAALEISDVADGTTEPEFEGEEDLGVDPACVMQGEDHGAWVGTHRPNSKKG